MTTWTEVPRLRRAPHAPGPILPGGEPRCRPESDPVKVNFYATLRPVVGGASVELPLSEGVTVRELVDVLVEKFPELAPRLLDEEGALRRHVHVFVNGRDAPLLPDRLATPLAPSDRVDVFPAVGGG